ncbi:MAG: hypothetical protein KA191_05400 [Verrucomicrobia bacterium]|jgi:hypothetical protein|nr:hypothetical protein [Verrucomicrobiota bacterium]OQC65705.1 MAG: hypothetical protein BWX48_02292 [Verrucomicrobia bacterium ADurb.Bin006]MDI9379426.1 hypothetical protein [Verrucomicrobiota bacterium]NMD21199.1 hypothetical protein [Verrucomicrobiota bacterium]HNV00177.1 hypothetical protein [Verrucomicrobiota bacterium]
MREHHAGELRRESAELRAEGIVAKELRRETALTVGWTARGLELRTLKSAGVELHRWTKGTQERCVGDGKTTV